MVSKKDKSLVDVVISSVKDQAEISQAENEILHPLNDLIAIIQDKDVQSFVKSIFYRVKTYQSPSGSAFWSSPSSMVSGVHPPDEYDNDGMLLHTKRVTKIAICMAAAIGVAQADMDLLIAAALLHDVTKAIFTSDMEVTHDSLHAYTADSFIEFMREDDQEKAKAISSNTLDIDFDKMLKITRLIRTSHGVLSPIPETFPVSEMEKIIAMADYLAGNAHIIFPEAFGIDLEDDDEPE